MEVHTKLWTYQYNEAVNVPVQRSCERTSTTKLWTYYYNEAVNVLVQGRGRRIIIAICGNISQFYSSSEHKQELVQLLFTMYQLQLEEFLFKLQIFYILEY